MRKSVLLAALAALAALAHPSASGAQDATTPTEPGEEERTASEVTEEERDEDHEVVVTAPRPAWTASEQRIEGPTLRCPGGRRDDQEQAFEAVLDIDEDTQMVGAPFSLEVRPDTTSTLVVRLLMVDPSTESDTVFDGVEFPGPEGDEPILIEPGDDAHNILRRRIQVHDHWWFEPRD